MYSASNGNSRRSRQLAKDEENYTLQDDQNFDDQENFVNVEEYEIGDEEDGDEVLDEEGFLDEPLEDEPLEDEPLEDEPLEVVEEQEFLDEEPLDEEQEILDEEPLGAIDDEYEIGPDEVELSITRDGEVLLWYLTLDQISLSNVLMNAANITPIINLDTIDGTNQDLFSEHNVENMVTFLRLQNGVRPKEIETIQKNLMDTYDIPEENVNFIEDVSQSKIDLYDLMQIAEILEIDSLTELGAAKIASMIKGVPKNEIRAVMSPSSEDVASRPNSYYVISRE